MSRHDRSFFRLALAAALVASLGLAACGRKGNLDPPPAASVTGERTVNPTSKGSKDAGFTTGGKLLVPKGKDEPIFLDGLLN